MESLLSYGRIPSTSSKFVFEQSAVPFASCHASTLVALANGDLLMAWFGGTDEGAPDVVIWAARLTNGTWSAPVEMVREPGTPTWNPVLFYTRDQRLWLYYKYGTTPAIWSAARKYSDDHGHTWSPVEYLPAGVYGPIRAKPLVLPDGTVVSGTSVESYRNWSVWIERSTDHGHTFAKIGPITVPDRTLDEVLIGAAPEDVPGSNDWQFTRGIIQPSVVNMGGAHLRLYARATAKTGRVCVADSSDSGLTWTQARPIEVPNPNSGIDAVALHDGRIVLIYNHTRVGRSPLNVAVSRDGETFTPFLTLEDTPGGEFSYPNIIQTEEGDLHISYTWQRRNICYVRVRLADVPLPS